MSLKYRIAVTIFALELIMMTLVLGLTVSRFDRVTAEQLGDTETAILGLMTLVSQRALLTGDYAEVQGYLHQVGSDPRVERAMLADDRAVVVASLVGQDIGRPLPELSTGQSDRFWRAAPVGGTGGPTGTVAMQFSNEPLVAAVGETRRLAILVAVVGMGAIAIVGVLTGVLLTRRLRAVSVAAHRFATGELDARSRVGGRDEVGQLGRAFDEMAATVERDQYRLREAHNAVQESGDELRRLNEDLEQRVAARTKELAEANRELEAFTYSVSHDLRAPLRAIAGYSELLHEHAPTLDDEGNRCVDVIVQHTARMDALINDLLAFSRLGQCQLRTRRVEPNELVRQVWDELRVGEPDRGLDFRVGVLPTTRADPGLLKQVFANLLSNALKFTRGRDSAVIDVSCHTLDGVPTFAVRDNGIGFDQRYVDKAFEVFQRLHIDSTHEGTGIGLSIVRRIVERHGGRVWADGSVNQGATFWFTLSTGGADG